MKRFLDFQEMGSHERGGVGQKDTPGEKSATKFRVNFP